MARADGTSAVDDEPGLPAVTALPNEAANLTAVRYVSSLVERANHLNRFHQRNRLKK
jgi:hypothetical protein